MNIKIVTPPTIEPVTLTEAKLQCRVDATDEDTFITGLITAAREEVERLSWHVLLTQTLELVLNGWPCDDEIYLPRPPLQSVTSVIYKLTDHSSVTWPATRYVVATDSVPAYITPAYGLSWPTDVLDVAEAVRVRYVAGWTSAALVPQSLKLACLLLIAHWYENREGISMGSIGHEVPMGVDALCTSYRLKAKRW